MLENSTHTLSNVELARQCVKELKEKHPNLSSLQLASKIGMSQSTFSRIENGQTNPSLNSLSILLTGLEKGHILAQVIDTANPSLAALMKKNLSHNIETPVMGGEFAGYFKLPSYRGIMLLAMTRSGTTRIEVQQEFGSAGIRKLEELIKNDILKESRGIIKVDEEKVTFDQNILKDTVIKCIEDNYDPEKYGTGKNWLSFQTESVDKEKALGLIRSKLQKVYAEIKEEILYSQEFYGNDKIFIAMAADSLLSEFNQTSGVIQ